MMLRRDQATALATAETLMHRLPLLWLEMLSPSPRGRAEMARMVSEKQKAAIDGMVAAQQQFLREVFSFGFLNPPAAWRRVLRAAAGPATVTVKANARRLRNS